MIYFKKGEDFKTFQNICDMIGFWLVTGEMVDGLKSTSSFTGLGLVIQKLGKSKKSLQIREL